LSTVFRNSCALSKFFCEIVVFIHSKGLRIGIKRARGVSSASRGHV
jgi:hypothetical protein